MHQGLCNLDILSIIMSYVGHTKEMILVCKTFYYGYLKDKEYRSNQVGLLRKRLDLKQGVERLEIYAQIAGLGHSLRENEYKDYILTMTKSDQKSQDLYHIGLCAGLMEIYYKNRDIYGLPSPTERNLLLFKNIFETGPYLNILVNLLTHKFDRDIYLFIKNEIDDTYWETTETHRHYDNILHHVEVENIECFLEYVDKRILLSMNAMEWGYLRDKMIQIMASASMCLSKESMKKLAKTNRKLLNCKTFK